MPEIHARDLLPGMSLERDVMDTQGRLLLAAGTVMDAKAIALLKEQNVDLVPVSAEGADPELDKALDQAMEYVAGYFLFVDVAHPAMQEVFKLALGRSMEAMAKGFQPPVEPEAWDARVTHLRDAFFKGEGKVEDLVRQEVKLASFPSVYFRIREALDDPLSTAATLAALVEMDPGLAARLLKLVNSPLYGFPSKIESITRAVTLVGGEELSTLALGMSAIAVFRDVPPELMDMRTFWSHSVAVAVFSRILAKLAGLSAENMFVAGLLHDIGRLLILKKLPLASAQSLIYARENALPLMEAESDVLGFDHALAGGLLAQEWKLPPALCEVIRHHHEPMAASEPKAAVLVQTADTLVRALDIAHGGRYMVPGVDPEAWKVLGLSPDDLEPAAAEFEAEYEAVTEVFLEEAVA